MPTDPPPSPADGHAADGPGAALRTRRRWVSAVGFALGLLLLAAAAWAVARQGDTLAAARRAAAGAPAALIAAVLLLPLLNWLLTSIMFLVLTRRYGRVGAGEMAALIGSAWLLNLLPMRPGMVGRIAYHKAVNNIRVRDSAKVLVQSLFCTSIAAGVVLVTGLALRHTASLAVIGLAAAAPAVGLLTAGCVPRLRAHTPLPIATGLRYLDVLVWSIRYYLVFTLVGHPVTPAGAAVIAAASQAAMVVPVQVGIREWIVGLAAAALPAGLYAASGSAAPALTTDPLAAAAPGLMADLMNRAAELVVVLPVGLACSLWLWDRRRSRRASGGSGGAGTGDRAPPAGESDLGDGAGRTAF